MINHEAIQLALRAKAVTLAVCTTGSISLSATASGYARAAGSFYDDGFAIGQEIAASGFGTAANNGASVVTAVTALALTVRKTGGTAVEIAGAGRSLIVGLPSSRSWENQRFSPVANVPYVEEQYVPGPTDLRTAGNSGLIVGEPMYILGFYLLPNTDIPAAAKYGDALLSLFAPRTLMSLSSGDALRVRGDIGPSRGQIRQLEGGFAYFAVTIPLRCFSTNAN